MINNVFHITVGNMIRFLFVVVIIFQLNLQFLTCSPLLANKRQEATEMDPSLSPSYTESTFSFPISHGKEKLKDGIESNKLQILWEHRHGPTSRRSELWGVTLGEAGYIYVCGFQYGGIETGLDVWVSKMTSDKGEIVWEQLWKQPFQQKLFEIVYDNRSHSLFVGGAYAKSHLPQSQDMLLMKLSANDGNIQWWKLWDAPGENYDEVDGILIEGDVVFVSGWAGVNPITYATGDIAVLKFSAQNGDILDQVIWGNPGTREEANGALVTDGQYLYLAGIYGSRSLLPNGGGDAVVVAFSKNPLKYEWHVSWGGSQHSLDDALGIAIDSVTGMLYAVGLTLSYGGKIFLMAVDSKERTLFNKPEESLFGGRGSQAARAIQVVRSTSMNDSSVFVVGKSSGIPESSHHMALVMLKYNMKGEFQWYKYYKSTQNSNDEMHGLTFNDTLAYVVGQVTHHVASAEIIILKASPFDCGNGTQSVACVGGPQINGSPLPSSCYQGFPVVIWSSLISLLLIITM